LPTGAHATPAAVRRQLTRLSTWCGSRRVDLADLAPWDRGDIDDPDVEVEGEWRVRTAAETLAGRAALTVAIGGDNSITYPVLAGALGDAIEQGGLVTLDAHHDIREGRSNGSPVRRVIDAGLDPERIVQLGIADWANSRSYGDEAHARGVTAISLTELDHRGLDECMREALSIAGSGGGPVYVDLDLAVCDRAVAPGCPASLPGGLSARQILRAAWLAGHEPAVTVIDITEVDATRDTDERTVRLAALCLLEAAAGLLTRQVPQP
jgi:formiminoglutamase